MCPLIVHANNRDSAATFVVFYSWDFVRRDATSFQLLRVDGAFSYIYDLQGIVSAAGLGSIGLTFVVPHEGSVSSVVHLCASQGIDQA
jgi:hypothetical protein